MVDGLKTSAVHADPFIETTRPVMEMYQHIPTFPVNFNNFCREPFVTKISNFQREAGHEIHFNRLTFSGNFCHFWRRRWWFRLISHWISRVVHIWAHKITYNLQNAVFNKAGYFQMSVYLFRESLGHSIDVFFLFSSNCSGTALHRFSLGTYSEPDLNPATRTGFYNMLKAKSSWIYLTKWLHNPKADYLAGR